MGKKGKLTDLSKGMKNLSAEERPEIGQLINDAKNEILEAFSSKNSILVKEQKEKIDSHAKEALMMASLLFAAGAFIGIMQKSGMITEMSEVIVSVIPHTLGKYLPILTGVVSMPASLLFDPDSFYFGILPVLSNISQEFGVSAISVGRAAILGQMTTGFPVSPLTGSTFLLIGLTGVELGEHQKKTIPLAFAVTIVMLFISVITVVLYQ